MLVHTYCAALSGIEAIPVRVEVNVVPGVRYHLVGLPDHSVKESLPRIEAAILGLGLKMPRQKVVINLSPADLRKEGGAFDLPIALAILGASGQIPHEHLGQCLALGELSLDGAILPVRGVLPACTMGREQELQESWVALENLREASLLDRPKARGFAHLKELLEYLHTGRYVSGTEGDPNSGTKKWASDPERSAHKASSNGSAVAGPLQVPDFSTISGQITAKRGLEVAAAGGHNLLMVGPPGSGKSLLAKALPGILPPMNLEESLECTRIHSVAGNLRQQGSLIVRRPFRAPHHSISRAALCGGGSGPMPGEISLAHNGVLFLDELPEFPRSCLESLRQPLEDGRIVIARARNQVEFPCKASLIAAMNPCPCGYLTHPQKECSCPAGAGEKYMQRVSGPLMDRIDIHLEVPPVGLSELKNPQASESSAVVRKRVMLARQVQEKRYSLRPGIRCNAQLPPDVVLQVCRPDTAGWALLKTAMERLQLSARAFHRILRLARTIADLEVVADPEFSPALENSPELQPQHLAEAIQYRCLDRNA